MKSTDRGRQRRRGDRTLSRRNLLRGFGAAGAATLLGSRIARSAAAGQIVVYSTTLPPVQAKLADAFTKKTGIAVQSLRLASGALAQRFIAEQRARQYVCDVVTLGNDLFFKDLGKAGLLTDIDGMAGVSALPAAWRPGKYYVLITAAPDTIVYNSKTVVGDSIPRGWTDMIKPEFKTQIVMPDPRANEAQVPFLAMLLDACGEDFMRKLGQQQISLVPAAAQGVEQVLNGESKLVTPVLAMNLVQYRGTGAPLGITPAPSPTVPIEFFSGIAANAPNPTGARQWFEYVLSPEGQQILCDGVGISPLGNIPGSLTRPTTMETPDLAQSLKRRAHIFDLLGFAA